MGATNKTTYYELPQYVQSDKPSYLGDFNGAMNTIDSAIHTNAVNIGINETNITNTNTTIGDLTTLKTSVKSNIVNAINENVDSIGDITNLETIVKTNVVSAINEVVEKFNLTDFQTFLPGDVGMRSSIGDLIGNYGFTVATNSDKSICKIYGDTTVQGVTPNNHFYVELDTNFDVDEEITINNCGISLVEPNSNNINYQVYIKILTNGRTRIYAMSTDTKAWFCTFPIVIFVKNFGDIPRPNNE